ncbi:MAG: DUF192 domain-containing protein [Actinobacteria bacterium]|jgi:uncharacterized membrane protein (UPF0127 family)|nr:DUF192 domain-containing protein [Actinomycetota bacterium]MCL6094649.1 DUF192 domain-containing protein [Actinomycetota bacterium]
MAWLLREGEVVAAVEIAESLPARTRGLLGRSSLDGALVLRPARAVHTFGMRFPIDVAFCDAQLVVIATITMPPGRICLPRRRTRCIIEAQAGAFERWKLNIGDHLELKA